MGIPQISTLVLGETNLKITLAAAAALFLFWHLASAAAASLHPELDDAATVLKNLTPKSDDDPATQTLKSLSPELDNPNTQAIPDSSTFNPRPAIAPPLPPDLNARPEVECGYRTEEQCDSTGCRNVIIKPQCPK
jgi:hypothetical protein